MNGCFDTKSLFFLTFFFITCFGSSLKIYSLVGNIKII